jgi:flagellar export protein FliJ
MSFQFSFATVLRIRRLHEEREEQMLRRIFHEISQVQQSIGEISEEMLRMSGVRSAEVHSRAYGCDLRLKSSATTALYECKRALEEQLEKLEQLKEAQMARYRIARRDREAISDLRDKGWLSYQSALAAGEQRMLDDNFNARRSRH